MTLINCQLIFAKGIKDRQDRKTVSSTNSAGERGYASTYRKNKSKDNKYRREKYSHLEGTVNISNKL